MYRKSALMTLLLVLLFGISNLTAQKFKEFDKSFPMDKTGKVTIETYKGSVIIEPWDKAEVHVYAKIVPDDNGFLSTSPKKQLARADVVFRASSNSVRIKSEYENVNSWFGSNTRAFVNYRIQMPKTAMLDINDYKSDIEISGIQSSLELETYKGNVKVRDLTGSINLETYKGDVDVVFSKMTDNSRFETYKGEIVVTLPKNSAFTVNADLGKNADFYSDFDLGKDAVNKKRKGYEFKNDVNGGGSEIKFNSDKGNITLHEK